MKLRVIFWAGLLSLISGLLFWRNTRRYPLKSMIWRILKSVSEVLILLLSAVRLPALLVTWSSAWLTKPIKTPWIRMTAGVAIGMVLGLFALYAMELLVIVGVFSIDDITGEHEGFLKNLNRSRQAA